MTMVICDGNEVIHIVHDHKAHLNQSYNNDLDDCVMATIQSIDEHNQRIAENRITNWINYSDKHKLLDLCGLRLFTLPKLFPWNTIISLHISGNVLDRIELPQCLVLYAKGCQLTFVNTPKAILLDLANNQLTAITAPNVKRMCLIDNPIVSIEAPLCYHLKTEIIHLRYLNAPNAYIHDEDDNPLSLYMKPNDRITYFNRPLSSNDFTLPTLFHPTNIQVDDDDKHAWLNSKINDEDESILSDSDVELLHTIISSCNHDQITSTVVQKISSLV